MKKRVNRIAITHCKYAVEFSDATTVKRLITAGADVSVVYSCGCKLLTKACESGTDASDKVRYLLQCDASLVNELNCTGATPLANAAASDNADVINVLIEYGADVSRGKISIIDGISVVDRPVLHYACENGSVSCIHALVAHGADVEAIDREFESTPLHLAVGYGHTDCAKILLEHYSASVSAVDKFGQTES